MASVNEIVDQTAAGQATLTDPVTSAERISAIDVLRGVALLGILVVNIEDFGRANDGHRDVLAGTWANPDRLAWAAVSVLFEGKMRAIFSMLFGAGVVLLTDRIEHGPAAAGRPTFITAARCGCWQSVWCMPISSGRAISCSTTR